MAGLHFKEPLIPLMTHRTAGKSSTSEQIISFCVQISELFLCLHFILECSLYLICLGMRLIFFIKFCLVQLKVKNNEIQQTSTPHRPHIGWAAASHIQMKEPADWQHSIQTRPTGLIGRISNGVFAKEVAKGTNRDWVQLGWLSWD